MWLQDKKGVSIMIGYVLLVTCAIIMGVIIYQWIKTYVPADALECPDGVSIFIKEHKYDCDNSKLSLTLKNNGLFNTAGYFIHATNESGQELATKDLSSYTALGEDKGGTVLFSTGNSFKPNDEKINMTFDLSGIEQIYSIEIIPVRFQEEEGKTRFVSCGGAKVKEILSCWVACEPETTEETCGTWVCGNRTNNCDEDVICPPGCTGDDTCINGVCVPPDCVPETTEETCGTWVCGTKTNNCGVIVSCPPGCGEGEVCDETGQCVSSCGNGVIDGVEECDDNGIVDGDGCSSTCTIETGWVCDDEEPSNCYPCLIDDDCVAGETCLCSDCNYQQADCDAGWICIGEQCTEIEGAFNSCGDYCSLFGYSTSYSCQDNPNKCAPPQGPLGGIYIGDVSGADPEIGNSFCSGDPYCCCVPY